jgi:hypothetical protein
VLTNAQEQGYHKNELNITKYHEDDVIFTVCTAYFIPSWTQNILLTWSYSSYDPVLTEAKAPNSGFNKRRRVRDLKPIQHPCVGMGSELPAAQLTKWRDGGSHEEGDHVHLEVLFKKCFLEF